MRKFISKSLLALSMVPAFILGAAPMALASGVSTTGPDSGVTMSSSNQVTVTNNNSVSITNTNHQTAVSGDATVSGNTTGGSATSGNASNSNTTDISVSIDNITSLPKSSGGSISTEGPNSPIRIYTRSTTTITNNNDVNISNSNHQFAKTGDAAVSGNTTGGSATSGNASNSNETDVCVAIFNSTANSNGSKCPASGGGNGGGNGGNNGGGNGGTSQPGGGGGQVLGVSTAAMSGGKGGAFATLPNTGLREGINAWAILILAVLIGSIAYIDKAIIPQLKTPRK
jgi:hypothetical protein